MKVTELYEGLHACSLARSQVEFSRIWLGRSDRYYSYLVATQREPGVAALLAVLWRLERLQAIGTHAADAVDRIVDQLRRHIELRSIRSRRSRRLPPQGRV